MKLGYFGKYVAITINIGQYILRTTYSSTIDFSNGKKFNKTYQLPNSYDTLAWTYTYRTRDLIQNKSMLARRVLDA